MRGMYWRHHKFVSSLFPDQDDFALVDITDIARWLYEESEREHWDLEEDFAWVRPPWPWWWMEVENSRRGLSAS